MKTYVIAMMIVLGISMLSQIYFLYSQDRERDLRCTAIDAVIHASLLAWGTYILAKASG